MRVFQNLIGNAIKYSDERPAEIHVSCKREASEWVFSVKETASELILGTMTESLNRSSGCGTPGILLERAWASRSAGGLSNAMADECGWSRRRGKVQRLFSRSRHCRLLTLRRLRKDVNARTVSDPAPD